MDFFDGRTLPDGPDEEPVDTPNMPPWFAPPPTVLGHVIAVNAVLARSPHAFVALPMLTVYPTGIAFTVQFATRRGDWSRDHWDSIVAATMHWHRPPRRSDPTSLRVGVRLADGTRLLPGDMHAAFRDDTPPDGPVLMEAGGHGGSSGSRQLDGSRGFWLWPAPEQPSFDIVIEWPAFEVPVTEQAVTVDPAADDVAVAFWG